MTTAIRNLNFRQPGRILLSDDREIKRHQGRYDNDISHQLCKLQAIAPNAVSYMFCSRTRGGFGFPAIIKLGKKIHTALTLIQRNPLKYHILKRPARQSMYASAMAAPEKFIGTTCSDLLEWLQSTGIDTSSYGRASSKSVDLLWEEIQEGETILTSSGGRAVRLVSVVNVLITNKVGQVLSETEQVLPNGTTRPRNRPLSEKLLPGEPWQDGVVRGIREELGMLLTAAPEIQVDEASYEQVIEEKESQSYPGLFTRYICHRVKANVSGLPEGKFSTEEDRADGTLKHIWAWE